jgi:hypothetical protein
MKTGAALEEAQALIDKQVNNGISITAFLRTVAILVVLGVIAWTIVLSIFTKNRFFPKQPSNWDLLKNAVEKSPRAIK